MEILDIIIVSLAAALGIIASFMAGKGLKLYWFIKPLPIFMLIFIMAYNIFTGSGIDSILPILVLIGLIAGVTGDILLLFPKKLFVFGLGAFLVGHLFYVAGFLQTPFHLQQSLPMLVFIAAVALIYGTVLFRKLEDKRMMIPIIFYIVAISTMAVTAFNFDRTTVVRTFPIYTIGALLFCLSDSVLAWITFVKKFRYCDLLVMTTYYSAQILIVVKTIMIMD